MPDPEMDIPDPRPEQQLRPARETEAPQARRGLKNFEDIMRTAAVAHKSRMLPKDVQTVEQAFWMIYNALDLGLPASSAFKFLYMTKGRKVAMTTRGQHAVIYRSGLCESYKEFIEGEGENMVAVASTKRRGFEEPFTKEFSYKDAEAAGLLDERTNRDGDAYDSTYDKYLKDMLLARARERVFGVAYPDVTGGLPSEGIAEEIERNEAEMFRGEPEPAKDVTPARPELPAAKGPDPFLEALSKKKGKEQPMPIEEGQEQPIPVEAEVIPPGQDARPMKADPDPDGAGPPAKPPPEPEPPEEEDEGQGDLWE